MRDLPILATAQVRLARRRLACPPVWVEAGTSELVDALRASARKSGEVTSTVPSSSSIPCLRGRQLAASRNLQGIGVEDQDARRRIEAGWMPSMSRCLALASLRKSHST